MSNIKITIILTLFIFSFFTGFEIKNKSFIKQAYSQTTLSNQKLLREARNACSVRKDRTSKDKISICPINNDKNKINLSTIFEIASIIIKKIQKLIYILATLYIIYAFAVSLWSKDIEWKNLLIMGSAVLFITIINLAVSWISGERISLLPTKSPYIVNCKRPNIIYKECSTRNKNAIIVMKKDIAYLSKQTYEEIIKKPEKKQTNKNKTEKLKFKTNMF